jgi:hypothetical protein
MNELSPDGMKAVLAQSTEEVFLTTVVLEHPDLDEPLRMVDNTQDILIAGEVYHKTGFTFEPPSQVEGGTRSARIGICNIDGRIIEILRSISVPPTLTVGVVRAAEPEIYEAGPFELTPRSVSYNDTTITAELVEDVDGRANCPAIRYTPFTFPGVF